MKKVFVFGIGGTGIRVIKSIIMLMASGMESNGYTIVPVIIDPHLDLEEKKNLHSLIDSYRKIYSEATNKGTMNALEGFFSSNLVTLEELNNQANDIHQYSGSKEKFGSYIKTSNLATDDINNYLIQTLFSTKNLDNSLSVGFKGNPNVGTVVLGDMIEGADWFKGFKQQCEKDDRIFIISSIFGGTGASGFPLLEKKIRGADSQPTVKNALMGAVTVLPYYGLKDPNTNNSDIDSANFYTKTKAALAYYNGKVLPDYLYYAGETTLRQVYENDEQKQDDKTHFIELVAASALFDFLKKERPEKPQYLTRAIEDDKDSMDLKSLGDGYREIVKCVADYKIFSMLVDLLPDEKYFPLRISRGLKDNFYNDEPFAALAEFTEVYNNWYKELSENNRAFAPLNDSTPHNMERWVKGFSLEAKDDSYYLLEMIKISNAYKSNEHDNKLRFLLQFAYEAINHYTQKKLK